MHGAAGVLFATVPCVYSVWRTIPVIKDKLDLRDDDDWLNAEVDSDRTPRFLTEFRAWTRKDEASDEVAEAVKWGWPMPSSTVH